MAPADDWVVRTAGEVRAEAMRRHPGEAPTCASGISPSGPVHLGNLRELMAPHLVADEVRKQGVPAGTSCPGTTTTGCAGFRPGSPSRSPSTSDGR